MRKVTFLMHTTLDNFVAGPKGEIHWAKLPPELFDLANQLTKEADTAIYGRITYGMMERYWPNAGKLPNATKHDKEHSSWYNKITKIVISKTLKDKQLPNTIILSEDIAANVRKIKEQKGKNIVIFGSPSVVQLLLNENLIDEFYLSVNPIILSRGIEMFKSVKPLELELKETKTYSTGNVLLHYAVKS